VNNYALALALLVMHQDFVDAALRTDDDDQARTRLDEACALSLLAGAVAAQEADSVDMAHSFLAAGRRLLSLYAAQDAEATR